MAIDPELIERRLAAYDRGETTAIDWRESIERARRMIEVQREKRRRAAGSGQRAAAAKAAR